MTYEVIVSHSGTRHIVGRPVHRFRISTLCKFGIKEEDALPLSEGTRDCPFCFAELVVIEQQQQDADQAA
jgi:hypothetical protein